ncbi:MAG: trypsin-like serine protease [Deltaproteobacteria bacterium]|nr:trypsin-like serine protease [Deltaproteobacteria bacterium]
MTKKTLVLILGLALLLPVACTGGDAQQSEFVQHDFPIINGTTASDGIYNAVVSLHQRTGDSVSVNIFCSGTLIAPDVVLTAAHCLDVGNRKPRLMSPAAVAIHFGPNPTDSDSGRVFYGVSETWMHPSYNSSYITNDIAMLRLDMPNNSVTPVPALPASLGFTSADETVQNSPGIDLDFAGFGADEHNEYDVKLHYVGVLGSIQSSTQIYYTQGFAQGEGGPCFGDSGGPAFVVRNGTTYVGGMTSYGDSSCAEYGVSTRADAYEALINDFVGIVVEPFCGDGNCDAGEDCANCADDCGECPVDPFCGDEECNGAETCATCEADCGACPFCGDEECNGAETCATCEADCGACPFCGDGSCDADEDCASCEGDCGVCQTCSVKGDPCSSGSDCCSGLCHPRKHTCK